MDIAQNWNNYLLYASLISNAAQFIYMRWAMKRDILRVVMQRVDKLEVTVDKLNDERVIDRSTIARLEERAAIHNEQLGHLPFPGSG